MQVHDIGYNRTGAPGHTRRLWSIRDFVCARCCLCPAQEQTREQTGKNSHTAPRSSGVSIPTSRSSVSACSHMLSALPGDSYLRVRVCVCVRARARVYSVSVSVCPRISSWCRLGFDDNNGKPDVRHFVQQSLDARESKIVRGTPAWLPRADGTCAAEVEVSAEVCLALLQGGVAFFVGYRHFFALRYLSHGHDE